MELSYDRSKIKVLLLEGVHPSAVVHLTGAGYTNVEQRDHALQGNALARALADVSVLGIRSRTQVTADALAAAPRLIAIGCFCIGTNQVNLEAATARAVPVFNAPYSNTRSVAELVLAEAMLLLRGVPARTAEMHAGVWQKSTQGSFEVRGKTLGVIGYGNIGSQLGVLAESMGMRVIFHDIAKKLNLGNARQVGTLEELLGNADIVSLHVPADPSTRHLIDRDALACMRTGAVLINASRGDVVDLDALAERLREGALLGAAIDVFPAEPKANDEPFTSPLCGVQNVILTPHIGGSTAEAQANIGEEVAEKLIRYSDNGSTLTAVNFPEVALPEHPGVHRLLHVHRNIPGVLSAVNRVFAELGINIAAQYLQTNATIGYAVIDLEAEHSATALAHLRGVEGTLKTRVLF